jgi:hypothetical protein
MTLTAAQEKEVALANDKRDADAAKHAEAERQLALKRQAQAEQQALYDAQPRVRTLKLLADLRKPHIGEDRALVLWHTVVQLVEIMLPLLPETKPLDGRPAEGVDRNKQEKPDGGPVRKREIEQQGDDRFARRAQEPQPQGD